jgi:hypothetical protein
MGENAAFPCLSELRVTNVATCPLPDPDPDLATVAVLWPSLPAAVKAGIVAMVRASAPKAE